MSPIVYLVGSMRNPKIPEIAAALREGGFEVFDDWWCVGPDADDCWRDYEQARGHSFSEALESWHAKDVFEFDFRHLQRADIIILALPAGRCGHLELGWAIGAGKPGYILLDNEPDRFDIMYRFATEVFNSRDIMIATLMGRYLHKEHHDGTNDSAFSNLHLRPDSDIGRPFQECPQCHRLSDRANGTGVCAVCTPSECVVGNREPWGD